MTKLDSVNISLLICEKASKEISAQLKPPQNLEVEKAIYPFVLASKKRYHGNYYTKFNDPKYSVKSMGLAIKRRDYAPISKTLFLNMLNIIMSTEDIHKAIAYVIDECNNILHGKYDINNFIISKTLKGFYKKPKQIAHYVLSQRVLERGSSTIYRTNDRIPYVFMNIKNQVKTTLQSELIETPEYILENKLSINYRMYIERQISKPLSQILELVNDKKYVENIFSNILNNFQNEQDGVDTSVILNLMKKNNNNKVKPLSISNYCKKYNDLVTKHNEEIHDDNDDSDNDSNSSTYEQENYEDYEEMFI